jgi:hypothetical protein
MSWYLEKRHFAARFIHGIETMQTRYMNEDPF